MAGGMHGRGHAWQGVCVAEGAYVVGGVHSRGVCMAGGAGMHCGGCAWQGKGHVWPAGMRGWGHVYLGGMCGRGACMAGGVHGGGGMRGRRDGHCCGWYASYWNAFLFIILSTNMPSFSLFHSKQIETILAL